MNKVPIKDIEGNLVEGIILMSHDQFLSVVNVKGDEKSMTITIPHYLTDVEGVNDEGTLRAKVKKCASKKVTLELKGSKITYKKGHLCSVMPVNQDASAVLKKLKYVGYKDTGFLTTLIDEEGNYIQGPRITVCTSFFIIHLSQSPL